VRNWFCVCLSHSLSLSYTLSHSLFFSLTEWQPSENLFDIQCSTAGVTIYKYINTIYEFIYRVFFNILSFTTIITLLIVNKRLGKTTKLVKTFSIE
jgi:hypothetical protein